MHVAVGMLVNVPEQPSESLADDGFRMADGGPTARARDDLVSEALAEPGNRSRAVH